MGPTGPKWAPCWPHEPCYLGAQPSREILIANDKLLCVECQHHNISLEIGSALTAVRKFLEFSGLKYREMLGDFAIHFVRKLWSIYA